MVEGMSFFFEGITYLGALLEGLGVTRRLLLKAGIDAGESSTAEILRGRRAHPLLPDQPPTTQQACQQLSVAPHLIKPDATIFRQQCVDGCLHRAGSRRNLQGLPNIELHDSKQGSRHTHPRRHDAADREGVHNPRSSASSLRTMTIPASSGQLRRDLSRTGWCSRLDCNATCPRYRHFALQFTPYRQKIQQKCALIVVKRLGQAVDVFPDRSVGDEHGKDEGTRSRHGGFGICTGIMRFMDPRIRRESGNRQEGGTKPAIRQAMPVSR